MNSAENIPEDIPGMIRKNPFGVPENYFNEFPSRLQERISVSPSPAEHRLYPARRVLAIAAMFMGLVTIGFFGLRVIMNGAGDHLLSAEEVSVAIEYFSPEIDDEMLIAAILESDIQLDDVDADLESDVIIEYLSTKEIDVRDMLIE
jgi:hypothetical protein